MGRKKKRAEETIRARQMPLFLPEEAPAAPLPAPPSQASAVPQDPPPRDPEKTESPDFLAALRSAGIEWAEECGLKPPFVVDGPERVDYPREGHGYVVTIREARGKARLGSARFTSAGARSFWSLDGIATG